MSYETLDFDIADGIARITLNRPDQANALNLAMAQELFAVSLICGTDPAVRAVLLTGTGKLFCGGGDLAAMDAAGDGREPLLLEMATLLHQAIIRFGQRDAPLGVAVNGSAGGAGLSILLAGDYVIAADTAKFVSGYTASGLTPDGSSTHFLAKHVGLLRANELMLTNRALSARAAGKGSGQYLADHPDRGCAPRDQFVPQQGAACLQGPLGPDGTCRPPHCRGAVSVVDP